MVVSVYEDISGADGRSDQRELPKEYERSAIRGERPRWLVDPIRLSAELGRRSTVIKWALTEFRE